MMQIGVVHRFFYIHPDGTCRIIVDTQPETGKRTVENLPGKWSFDSGTITMRFASATVVMRDAGHDSQSAHWIDDQHGGREEDWTVLAALPTGLDADQAENVAPPFQEAVSQRPAITPPSTPTTVPAAPPAQSSADNQPSHIQNIYAVTTGDFATDERVWNALNASHGGLHDQIKEQVEEGHGQLPQAVVNRLTDEAKAVEQSNAH